VTHRVIALCPSTIACGLRDAAARRAVDRDRRRLPAQGPPSEESSPPLRYPSARCSKIRPRLIRSPPSPAVSQPNDRPVVSPPGAPSSLRGIAAGVPMIRRKARRKGWKGPLGGRHPRGPSREDYQSVRCCRASNGRSSDIAYVADIRTSGEQQHRGESLPPGNSDPCAPRIRVAPTPLSSCHRRALVLSCRELIVMHASCAQPGGRTGGRAGDGPHPRAVFWAGRLLAPFGSAPARPSTSAANTAPRRSLWLR